MNKVGEIFNDNEAIKGCREMDIQGLHRLIAGSGLTRAGSWGFRKPAQWKNMMYSFRVNGHHHKGLVNIVLDGSDTFTIYYVSLIKREIKKIKEYIYIDQLIDGKLVYVNTLDGTLKEYRNMYDR